jgi:hypothetical protein
MQIKERTVSRGTFPNENKTNKTQASIFRVLYGISIWENNYTFNSMKLRAFEIVGKRILPFSIDSN